MSIIHCQNSSKCPLKKFDWNNKLYSGAMDIFLKYLKTNFIIIIIIIIIILIYSFDGDNRVPLSSGDLEQRPVAHKMSFIVCHRILILELTTTTITEGAHSFALFHEFFTNSK